MPGTYTDIYTGTYTDIYTGTYRDHTDREGWLIVFLLEYRKYYYCFLKKNVTNVSIIIVVGTTNEPSLSPAPLVTVATSVPHVFFLCVYTVLICYFLDLD